MTKTVLFKVWAGLTGLLAALLLLQLIQRLFARSQVRLDFAATCATSQGAKYPPHFCENVSRSIAEQPDGLAYAFEAINFPVLVLSALLVLAVFSAIAALPLWGLSRLIQGIRDMRAKR